MKRGTVEADSTENQRDRVSRSAALLGERHLWVLLIAHLATRVLFLLVKPINAVSVDMGAWYRVATELREGRNPYLTTEILVHPPFGMQVAWAVDRISGLTDLQFPSAYWLFLMPFEVLLVAVCYATLRNWHRPAFARRLTFLGISLQPAIIFQVCQHGNIDLFVGLFSLTAAVGFVGFIVNRDRARYFGACLCGGMGILVKVVPIMLAPLLLAGVRLHRWRTAVAGGLMFALPAVTGIAALAATSGRLPVQRILDYRSSAGYFGISGLLLHSSIGNPDLERVSRKAFPLAAIGVVAFAAAITWRMSSARSDGRWVFLAALLVLLFVTTLGPGYAPQYIYWWWPLLVVCATLFGRTFYYCAFALWLVAAATFTVEYGFFQSHGALFSFALGPQNGIASYFESFESPAGQTMLRLPLFVGQLVILLLAVTTLARSCKTAYSPDEQAGNV